MRFWRSFAASQVMITCSTECVRCVWTRQTLSIFCGLGMHNCQLHKNRERLRAQLKVTSESLLFYAAPDHVSVEKLVVRLHLVLRFPLDILLNCR